MKRGGKNPKQTTRIDSISNNNNSEGGNPVIGEVGFSFTKYFPGYGYFKGTVTQIRPGARKFSSITKLCVKNLKF